MDFKLQHSPPHPGEILQDLYLEPLGLTVTKAAEHLHIARPNLSAILNGRAGISPEMALKLALAFNTTPQYWMNLQISFDLWSASQLKGNLVRNIKVLIPKRRILSRKVKTQSK
ncbi:MAG: HigA family addiction module antidote protein [Cyclobacteriaceae bacterium]|nr:HigA family addiction module antidote protein [Cyclobacteriaceae bacterium]